MTAWHLGPLHPMEQFLTFALAFGPFLVLGVVIWVRRRQDAREGTPEQPDEQPDEQADDRPAGRAGDQAER